MDERAFSAVQERVTLTHALSFWGRFCDGMGWNFAQWINSACDCKWYP